MTTTRHGNDWPHSTFALSGFPGRPVVLAIVSVGKSSVTVTLSESSVV